MQRRDFFLRVLAGAAGASGFAVVVSRSLGAQAPQAPQAPTAVDSSNLFAMDQQASRPVRLPPKPGARAVVSAAERDELEHRLRCQCGCTLDVYTCRTTDFSCGISPAMHRDVVQLIDGGYTVDEIRAAFVGTYGEQVLMAPKREGFNLAGYYAPFAALLAGGGAVAVLIRKWGARAAAASAAAVPVRAAPVDATPDELARLEAAIREDES